MIKEYKLVIVISFILFVLPEPVNSLDLNKVVPHSFNDKITDSIKFDHPILSPGSIWIYNVTFDIYPENRGKMVVALIDNSTKIINNSIYYTFIIVTPSYKETQLLDSNIFDRKIKTKIISRDDMGMKLTFDPELIHFDYPLYPGKSWGDTINYTGLIGGVMTEGTVTYIQKVIRMEHINTPAGTFDTMVVENTIIFPILGLNMKARLWIDVNGLLIKREAYINGAKIQEIELISYNVPLSSMLNQTIGEVYLLKEALDMSSPKQNIANLDSNIQIILKNLRKALISLEKGNNNKVVIYLFKSSNLINIFIKNVEKVDNPNVTLHLLNAASVIKNHIDSISDIIKSSSKNISDKSTCTRGN